MTAGMGRILSAAMVLTIVVPLAVAAIVAVRSWKDAIADFVRGLDKADSVAVYTFSRTGAPGRTETAKLTVSDGAALDALGHSVAINGDTIVAGAPSVTVGKNAQQGAVYTFTRDGALGAAVGWLTRARGVAHVGVLGFSQGSFIAAQVAPDDPRIEALVLEGAIANFTEATWQEFRRWGPLSRWPAYLGRRVAGYAPSDPQPDEVLARFNRPLLIIRGDADRAVPSSHTERLFALAPGPKERWIIPGADHGNYAAVAPVQYAERLAAFFERALLR